VDNEPPFRVVFELRPDMAPKMVENFIKLCKGLPDGRGYKVWYPLELYYFIVQFKALIRTSPNYHVASRVLVTDLFLKYTVDPVSASGLSLK
jgi:hypothetical protein